MSGVSPLSVFFEATDGASTQTSNPFHEVQYSWDFGDASGPSSGSWSYGNPNVNDRNTAYGPEAAHVFEVAEGSGDKTFTVTLTAYDGVQTSTQRVTITVYDPAGPNGFPGAKTICVSNTAPTGDFTGAPSGATLKYIAAAPGDFDTAINTYAKTGTRVLFRAGETWTARLTANVTQTGPGSIGKFGSGTTPVVNFPAGGAASGALQFSSPNTPGLKDWRCLDLKFVGAGTTSASNAAVFQFGGIDQLTYLRLDASGCASLAWNYYPNLDHFNAGNGKAGHTMYDQLTVQDCTFSSGPNLVGDTIFTAAARLAILGNSIDNAGFGNAHCIRVPYAWRGVIAHNVTTNAPFRDLCLKLHAPTRPTQSGGVAAANGAYSEKVVICDNDWVGTKSGSAIDVSIGPQDTSLDERVRTVLYERNWHVMPAPPGSPICVEFRAVEDVTIRNNLFDMSNATVDDKVGIDIANTACPVASTNVSAYNNTFYCGDSVGGSTLDAIRVESGVLKVTAKNNLLYSTSPAPAHTLTDRSGGTATITAATNTGDVGGAGTSPKFASATPSKPADFKIQATSYAAGKGSGVKTWLDYFASAAQDPPNLGMSNHV